MQEKKAYAPINELNEKKKKALCHQATYRDKRNIPTK
jgi:hypothetical protein